jgi:hypothetical protein
MSDSVTVKIAGEDVEFGFIGRAFRLECVEKIRNHRHMAFKNAISDLPVDPVSISTQVSSAIDAYMSGVIVGDEDVNQWLHTPEGFFGAFKASLKVASPGTDDAKTEKLHDRLDDENMAKLRDYWGPSLQGSRYNDIIEAVRAQAEADVHRMLGTSKESVDAYLKWLDENEEADKVDESKD